MFTCHRPTFSLACCLALTLLTLSPAKASGQTNFVVLLVDDAGLMDFGGYGGEARTPNINQLADQGMRFGNYHTSPLCSTSRAMLLTGLDNHRTGVGTIPEVLHETQAGSPAYAMRLLPGVKTIARRLKEAGYATFMTGKWHLGSGDGDLPHAHGFERSFALDASGADNWEHKSFLPLYADAPWFEDGQPARLPEDFYSSQFIVDKMIEYLGTRDRTRPFFSYLAFQAIHIPVQAPREFTDHYQGVYAAGWDVLRTQRISTAQRLGLLPERASPPEPHPSLRAWDDLSADEQRHYEHSMMVNAGMLEAMDHHIGRLVEYLEQEAELSNTVFIITSDNGPEFGDPATNPIFRLWMAGNGYHTDTHRAGERGYLGAIGPEWASVAAVPGSLFKMYTSEGGTRVPLIISGPGVQTQAGFSPALSFVTDIAPTIAEMAKLPAMGKMDGRSLLPVLSGTETAVYGENNAVGMEVAGNSALFKGRYKLTRTTRPHGDARWRLHDLLADPAERDDLLQVKRPLGDELLGDYEAFAAAAGVIPLPEHFDIQAQINVNTQARWLARNRTPLMFGAVTLLALLAGLVYVVRRRTSNHLTTSDKNVTS